MLRLLTCACVLLMASHAATAGPIRLLSDARSIFSSGTANTTVVRTYFDDGRTEVTEELQTKARIPVVHPANSFGLFDAGDGMALRTASATLDGQGAQRSLVNTSSIAFAGLADVFATGESSDFFGPDFQEETRGVASGSARSSFLLSFALADPLSLLLSMTSDLTINRIAGFTFSLTGDNGFAWTDPFLIDSNGELQFTFSTNLNLAPGTYTLAAELNANAFGAGGQPGAGRTTAEFSLIAATVPEPSSLLLVVMALVLIAPARRPGAALFRNWAGAVDFNAGKSRR